MTNLRRVCRALATTLRPRSRDHRTNYPIARKLLVPLCDPDLSTLRRSPFSPHAPPRRGDQHLAVEHVTTGGAYGTEAFIDLRSGAILCGGIDAEVPFPDDVYDEKRYLPVPAKKELGLGRDDALAFTEHHAPQLLSRAEYIFNAAGAFDRFKLLVREHGLLNAWYAYQDERLRQALAEWAGLNDLRLAGSKEK